MKKNIKINEDTLRNLIRESIDNVLNDRNSINDKLQIAYKELHDLYHMELSSSLGNNVKSALESVRQAIMLNKLGR